VERWRLDADLRAEALQGVDSSRESFGFDLYTTEPRFFRVGVVSSPVGKNKTTKETITTIGPDGTTSTVVVKSVKNTDDFTFNAQVGWRLGQTNLRAGLFESTGGLGVDRFLLKDKGVLTLEAYDFSRDEKAPHLRFEGRYFMNRNLYLFTGYDDPRWRENRSLLIGGGITWTDDDLKYLMGTAASAVHP
jgi:phospholipid/cholesterol/gamma-HCH transport system substrate-binding protein